MMLKYYFIIIIVLLFLFSGCSKPGNVRYTGIQTNPSQKAYERINSGESRVKDNSDSEDDENYYYNKYALKTRINEDQPENRNITKNEKKLRENIIKTAKKYIGVKYKYGGSDPGGFDCSGFSLFVYKQYGISLPRSADSQFKKGHRVMRNEVLPGDLVFFSDSGSKITHVGIYLGDNSFIHAPSTGKSVEITQIDAYYYSTRLAGYVSFIK